MSRLKNLKLICNDVFKILIQKWVKKISIKLFESKMVKYSSTTSLILSILLFGICHCDVETCVGANKFGTTDGTMRLIGLFPIIKSSAEEFASNALLWSEVFRYSVKTFNLNIHTENVFDYTCYDICGPGKLNGVTDAVVDIILSESTVQLDGCQCLQSKAAIQNVIGIVGPTTSSKSVYANEILSFTNLPMISYAATSPILSDKNLYPNFFRTVPPDTLQARLIGELFVKFQWTYVSIITTDSSYGRTGKSALNEEFQKRKICVAVDEYFRVPYHAQEAGLIMEKIKKETLADVIILWGSFSPVKHFLQDALEKGIRNKTWIISEASGRNKWFAQEENKKLGTFIIISPVSGSNPEFERYFFNLSISDVENPWLKTYFQYQRANDSAKLGDYKEFFDTARVGFIQDAVSAYMYAYLEYVNATQACNMLISPCNATPIFDHGYFNEFFLKNITFESLLNKTVRFNKNGDVTSASFYLYSVASKKSEARFVNIAMWSSDANFTYLDPTLYLLSKSVHSKCADSCKAGFYPIYHGSKSCCWTCVACPLNYMKTTGASECTKCPDQQVSNMKRTRCVVLNVEALHYDSNEAYVMYVFVLLGISTTAWFIVTFIKFKHTPVVRSSNFELSLTQLSTHLLLFACPLLFLHDDSKLKCTVRVYMSCLLVVIILSITLVKITHILGIFKLMYIQTKAQVFQRKSKELLIIAAAVFMQICLAVGSFVFSPIEVIDDRRVEEYKIYKKCNDTEHLLLQVVYILLLQIICGVQAFRGRNLPSKYNEAKYLAFAMFSSTLLVGVTFPLYMSMTTVTKVQLLLGMVMIVSNFLILTISYGFKIFVVWFRPDQNSLNKFRRNRMKSVISLTRKQLDKRESVLSFGSATTIIALSSSGGDSM